MDLKSKYSSYKKLKQKKQRRDKSGITRKASDKALFDVAWPQEFCGNGDLTYDDLSLPALVRGENFIINNIGPPKFSKLRANHLMQLMYFSEQFSFGNVLKYHHDILKDIESGRASWKSNFDSIRARRLVDRVPRQYCSSYNRSVCKKKEGHFNCYGITEEHICSNFWLIRKTVAYHPQKDCRVSGNYSRKGDKETKDTSASHTGSQISNSHIWQTCILHNPHWPEDDGLCWALPQRQRKSKSNLVVSSVPSVSQDSFKDTFISMHNQVFQSGLPNFQGCRLKVPSTFDIELWRGSLVNYNDNIIVDFLEYGWPVNYTKLEFPVTSYRNLKSV